MKVIVCVDDTMGMMFNKRRQSKDAVLRQKILSELNGAKLWMNAYSKKQFEEDSEEAVCVDEDFLKKAGENDYCFVENVEISNWEEMICEIILYKWNRRYPSDKKFRISLDNWKLNSTEEFAGSSHEKITKEVYIK